MVRTVQVDSGAVHFVDRVVRPASVFDVTPIGVRLDSVGSDPAGIIRLNATAALGGGATANVTGTMTREPATADLELALTRLDLTRVQPYLGGAPRGLIESGRAASLAGKVRIQPGRPATTFDGSASISGLETVSPDGERLIAWTSLRASGLHVTTDPDLARIRKVELTQPFLRIGISREREVNLAALATISKDTTSAPFPYELVELTIADAEVDFADLSLVLPFRTRIHSATGKLTDVASFGGTPGALEFEGLIEEDGRASATGTLHVSDPYLATQVVADFRNISLPGPSPYSLEFAGYPVTHGRLDLTLDYRIRAGRWPAHHIVASDLELGDKVEGGARPGLRSSWRCRSSRTARGRSSSTRLVEAVDDPQFRYSAVVWQVLKQMLGKIATAPFRFLGNMLGIGSDDIELVDFDPGSAEVIRPSAPAGHPRGGDLACGPNSLLSIEGRYDSFRRGGLPRGGAPCPHRGAARGLGQEGGAG